MRWQVLTVFLGACLGWFVLKPHAQERFAWREVSPGVEMRRLEWDDNGYRVRVIAFRCSPSRLRVATANNTLSATQWRQREGAIVAVNGGYFDAQNRSLGLRIVNGRRVNALHGTRWSVFRVKNGQARIVSGGDARDALKRGVKYQYAVQCGPVLVRDNVVAPLKTQWARRTGLGVQIDGRVVVAISEGQMSLPGWAKCWKDARALNCPNALNLDGGSSTQLSLSGTQKLDIQSARDVPDAVVISRR